jgi:hypothetical protein
VLALAGLVGIGAATSGAGGTRSEDSQRLAEALAAPTQPIAGAADLQMSFIQEDGPESGHVRIVLTPEIRPLTVLEARAAAEEAFLRALDEPGLGDALKRIVVVVRLMPPSHPDPADAQQIFRFQHKGGRQWGVFLGE